MASVSAYLEEIRSRGVYLTQTDHKLLYISEVLGYSEQSAFQGIQASLWGDAESIG